MSGFISKKRPLFLDSSSNRSPLRFRTRRWIAIGITIIAVLLVMIAVWIQSSRLGDVRWLTGWILFTSLIGLMLLGVRRRLPILPLGKVSTWTQIHLYAGLFATAIYALHVPALIASGPFNFLLSISFIVVASSGLYGVYASRTIPKRLTVIEGQHRFDQVGWHRDQINDKACQLIKDLGQSESANVLRHHFTQYLEQFFSTRASLRFMLLPNSIRRRRLLAGFRELNRYLDTETNQVAGKLAALVRYRDDVDYQFALQLRLRSWIVFHSILSVALIVMSVIHAVIMLRFTA